MKIAVDVGYGYTKVVAENGFRHSFPSAVAPAGVNFLSGVFSGSTNYRIRVSDIDSTTTERLVGEAALYSPACRTFIAREEKPADMHDTLLLTAVALATKSYAEEIELAVGLPVSYYRTQKHYLRERLLDIDARVSINEGEDRRIKFSSVEVFPQGAGALSVLDSFPERGLVGLVDIGTYTTDFLLFRMEGYLPIPIVEACGSAETGIFIAHKALAIEYEKITGTTLPIQDYASVFEETLNSRPVLFRGREINLTQAWRNIRKQIADTITSSTVATWSKQIDRLALTVFAGGGSPMFFDILNKTFPCPLLLKEGYYANAAGFLRMCSGKTKANSANG